MKTQAESLAPLLCSEAASLSALVDRIDRIAEPVADADMLSEEALFILFESLSQDLSHDVERLASELQLAQHPRIRRGVIGILAYLRKAGLHEAFDSIISQIASHSDRDLRFAVTWSLGWLLAQEPFSKADVHLIARMIVDPDPTVKAAAFHAAGAVVQGLSSEVYQLVLRSDFEESPEVAEKAYDLLTDDGPISYANISDEEVDTLLAKLIPLSAIEGQHDSILRFLSFAARRRPRRVVEVLLARIERCGEAQKAESSYRPFPMLSHRFSLMNLGEAEDSTEFLREMRKRLLMDNPDYRFWIPKLIRATCPDLATAISLMMEWGSSRDARKVEAAPSIIEEYGHRMIYEEHGIIADLLENAQRLGADCYDSVDSTLFGIATTGDYSSAGGEVSPRLLQEAIEAKQLAEKYADRPAAQKLYDQIRRHSEQQISERRAEIEERFL
jgi:hypothetical protein